MASFNVTVEDSSPMISYSPAGSWIDTPADDTLAASYSGGTFHTTAAQGATATIAFNGTGLSIFGGHRSNYGTYSIAVDGQTITSGSAESADSSVQQLLGTVSGLPDGPHTAVLTNTGGNPIDIDWIDFENRVGDPGAVGIKKSFDDTDMTISYLPSPSAWQTSSNPAFSGGTLHYSSTPGASAMLTFTGEAVAIYGTVSPDHANIQVTIDGVSQIMQGGSGGMVSALRSQVLLYYQNNLSPGQHALVFSGNTQPPAGPFIDLDSIDVFAAAESPATSTGDASGLGSGVTTSSALPRGTVAANDTLAPNSPSRIATGTIVGAVLGGIIFLLLLLAVVGFLVLRRRRVRRDVEKSMMPISPQLPMQGYPKAVEAGLMGRGPAVLENMVFPLPPPKSNSLRHSIAPSYYSDPYSGYHSRNDSMMSASSTAPLVPTVPMLGMPQPPKVPRKPAPATSGLYANNANSTPARPSNRPPTMDFVIVE
ncbi:hypothetical protein B0H34DRAFT_697962 [Crassisporium funariophilum]|nr:hypothetical protein B0H34DRAFT_697962 [Crassisporium funariophilum]